MTYLFASLLPIEARQAAVNAEYSGRRTLDIGCCPVGIALRLIEPNASAVPSAVEATAFITNRFGGEWKAVRHSTHIFMKGWDAGRIDKHKLADIFGVDPS